MTASYWGYQTLCDCSHANLGKMQDRDNIYRFSKTLVDRIAMEPIGEPIILPTAMHLPDKAGYSLIQLIQTSNIVAHFVDSNRSIYIDCFSCKPFDVGVVEDTIREFFDVDKIRVNFITRHAED